MIVFNVSNPTLLHIHHTLRPQRVLFNLKGVKSKIDKCKVKYILTDKIIK